MTFWQQQRIPVTRGWGPCKRTQWIPIREHYSHQGADGYTRTRDWGVSMDPGVFASTGGYYGPRNTGHVGFVERGPGGDMVVPRYRGDRGDRGDSWNNRDLSELLDGALARRMQDQEDRQAGADRRAESHRNLIREMDERMRDIDKRLPEYLEDYLRCMEAPISDARLTLLRAEAEVYADRGRQRADEQSKRDVERLREMHNAAVGRDTRRDMDRGGFVPVTPVWRGRW